VLVAFLDALASRPPLAFMDDEHHRVAWGGDEDYAGSTDEASAVAAQGE